MLASTSICFDMSVFEIFATLAEGGKLLLAENALALPDLAAAGRGGAGRHGAVGDGRAAAAGPPAVVDPDGEPGRRAAQGLAGAGDLRGSSPASSGWSTSTVPRRTRPSPPASVVPRDAGHPLIGRPLTGEAAYVLDAEMRPVPLGIPGALYIGGEGVTRGYLDRPDLTAERYHPQPLRPAGLAAVPGGGPGALPADGGAGLPGTPRPPGEGARLPHRAGGDRVGADPPSGGAGGRGPGDARGSRRQPPGRLGRVGNGTLAVRPSCARSSSEPARLHGALGLRAAARDAADPERQDRPPGAGGDAPATGERRRGGPRSPQLRRGGARRDLERGLRPARSGWATTSSTSAAIRCSPSGWSPASARSSTSSCRSSRCSRRLPSRGSRRWIEREMENRRGVPLPPIGRIARDESGSCRSPSPSSGSGSSTASSRGRRPSTCPRRCA